MVEFCLRRIPFLAESRLECFWLKEIFEIWSGGTEVFICFLWPAFYNILNNILNKNVYKLISLFQRSWMRPMGAERNLLTSLLDALTAGLVAICLAGWTEDALGSSDNESNLETSKLSTVYCLRNLWYSMLPNSLTGNVFHRLSSWKRIEDKKRVK